MTSDDRLTRLLNWLQAEQYPHPPHAPLPFITISRQAGAGGRTLARLLVDRLNRIDPGDTRWAAWDRELVEQVAAEEHVPQSVIDDLEQRRAGSWLNELFAGLSLRENPDARDRVELYRRMAGIIRAVARAGRAVLVGHGSVFATEDIPGGIHVRLVAPLEHRITQLRNERSLSREQALAELRRIEQERERFYHRFFPGKPLSPEQFTITLNTAIVTEPRQAAAVVALLQPTEMAESCAAAPAASTAP
jgi:hypothetical protein